MDVIAVRELFDRTLRAEPPPADGVARAWFDGVLRTTRGDHHFITWWDFGPDRTAAIVAREAARARSVGGELRWTVYGHDRPEGLDEALAGAGFDDQFGLERFLALDVSARAGLERPPGVDVRQASTPEDLEHYVAVACEAYADAWYASAEARAFYLQQLEAGTLFLAYVDGAAAATGRLDAPNGRLIAGLFDGSVVPQHRGKGLYRALVCDRVAEAARRGARYLYVVAWESSRPILERLGFQPLTTRHVWTLKAPSPS